MFSKTFNEKRRMKVYRKSIRKKLKEHILFCASICSIHGVPYIVKAIWTPIERFFWLTAVLVAFSWSIVLSLQAVDRYKHRPTVISLERDSHNWEWPFPSATICFQGISNMTALQDIQEELGLERQEDKDEFEVFVKNLATDTIFTFDNMRDFRDRPLYNQVDKYVEWVQRISAIEELNFILNNLEDNGNKFEPFFTELGACYAYNSKIYIYSTPNYWAKNTMNIVPVGETLKINPRVSIPSVRLQDLELPYKIFFHGPFEIPDVSTRGRSVDFETLTEIDLTFKNQWLAREAMPLQAFQRHCRMSLESNLKHSPVYSYNLCRIECRINLCLKLCGCTPYYYRRLENEPICNTSGMYCLSKHAALIATLNNSTNTQTPKLCSCENSCEIYQVSIINFESTDWFLGTHCKWTIKVYPDERFKVSLIFSSTDLLVQIGSVAGLMLGCSILSGIELLYFVTFRLYWGVFHKKKVKWVKAKRKLSMEDHVFII